MTGEQPRLLARERDELSAVVDPLREGRRVVAFLVCTRDLRPVVLEHLRTESGVSIPDPRVIGEPDAMLDALTEAAEQPRGAVRSLAVDTRAADVVRTLNWHREKLRRGASMLLWIDGVEGLRALRSLAPDAYSFRDVMIVVEGEAKVPVVPPEEKSLELVLARKRYHAAREPIERAEAALDYVEHLRFHGAIEVSRLAALAALSALSPGFHSDERARLARAGLHAQLASMNAGTQCALAHRFAELGLREIEHVDSVEARRRRLSLLSDMHTPLGFDDEAVRRILASPPDSHPSWIRVRLSTTAALSAIARGDIRYARSQIVEVSKSPDLSFHNVAVLACVRAKVDLTAGLIADAERHCRAATRSFGRAGTGTLLAAVLLAECMRVSGEQASAAALLEATRARSSYDVGFQLETANTLAKLRVDQGDVEAGLRDLRAVSSDAATARADRDLYDASATLVSSVISAHDAGRLAQSDLAAAELDLQVAEDRALSIAGDDPPWYTILYPGLRAELLALHPERVDEAIALARAAVDRARARWPEALPMHARMLAGVLLGARRFDEAREVLERATPEAEAQRHLRELARMRAQSIAILAHTAAPEADLDQAVASLRAVLAETDAPRIVAETLRELGSLLPRTATSPDPLALLDEAHALFVEMPIPAEEARCLELTGDVLSARGDRSGARRAYLSAKGVCERYGLGLRVPVLTSKVSAAEAEPVG